jgi:DNA-binding CsgD family transcriptional regulator
MLTSADFQKLNTATLALYAPPFDAGNWMERAFAFLGAIVPAETLHFASYHVPTGATEIASTFTDGDWEKAAEGYVYCAKEHRCYDLDPAISGDGIFFRSDHVSDRQFTNSGMYAECFRILGGFDHASLNFPIGGGTVLWFSTERAGRRHYTERDRLMLELAKTHVANAHRLALARQPLRGAQPLAPADFARAGFTPRECEVACWLTEGKSNVEIAALLRIHVQSVKAHVTALFDKTGAGNRLALTLHLLEVARAAPPARAAHGRRADAPG